MSAFDIPPDSAAPQPPDWTPLVIGGAFIVLALAYVAVQAGRAAWRRRQARKEAPEWGALAGDEYSQWCRLRWSLLCGETAQEPDRGRR